MLFVSQIKIAIFAIRQQLSGKSLKKSYVHITTHQNRFRIHQPIIQSEDVPSLLNVSLNQTPNRVNYHKHHVLVLKMIG